MLTYYSPNIKNTSLFSNVNNFLKLFEGNNFKEIWNLYIGYCKALGRTVGDVSFREGIGNINVMGIKRDPEIHFNSSEAFYNDILVVSQNVENGQKFYVYKVTMDPKNKKNKIAHLLLGMYDSYNIRPHRWISSRIAICQDRDEVFIARTDKKGNVINAVPYNGLFGINIHDSDIFINTSLGCTVLEKDSIHNKYHYKKSLKPLLKTVANVDNIVYAVASLETLSRIYYSEHVADDLPFLPMDSPVFTVAVDKKASLIKKYFPVIHSLWERLR